MIQVTCACGWQWSRPESAPKLTRTCPTCNRNLTIACAEPLPPGAGEGDFDAYFEILAGPGRVGERVFLGGVADLTLGRQDGLPIHLPGAKVSRRHATLARVDFGPSRWSIADNDSSHGLAIDDHRVTFRELRDGDVITLGEYQLRFGHTSGASSAPLLTDESGQHCPSCHRDLPASAHACIPCGIRLPSGRPLLLLTKDSKQEIEAGRAVPWLTPLTWLIWLTPLPIPLLSEASGSRQPWAIRLIAAVTVVTSLAFLLLALSSHRILDVPGKNFMLWPPGITADAFRVRIPAPEAKRLIARMNEDELDQLAAARERLRGTVPDDQLDRRALEDLANTYFAPLLGEPGQYQPHQLVTHAFLHDKSSLWRCALHLGSNLVFMIVFGTRINAVIGNLATLILYPVLAIGAALAHLHFGHPQGAMVGASGAINGLAGMYLVLFPLHRVYCGMWARFRIWCAMRIFAVRGFWILLLYFGIDAVTAWSQARSGGGSGGGTAHFAHLGGFLLGVAIAFAVLLSRAVNCGGGDLLSVTLGRFAWPLIGRPARHPQSPAA
jgi:membrane associated rhomboid family serine protease/pSer/pThr/pTyr-binding forkhead associated (FHA) protein